jgi:hypothetical protein
MNQLWGWLIITAMMAFIGSVPADSHLPDCMPGTKCGDWMMGLKANGDSTNCCTFVDGQTIATDDYFEVEGATPKELARCRREINHTDSQEKVDYCVRLFDQWWLVPARNVLREPNHYGQALAWGSWGWENVDGKQRQVVSFFRCFMPGAGI